MKLPERNTYPILVATLGLTLAACGTEGATDESDAPDTEAAADADESELVALLGEPETREFSFAINAPGVSWIGIVSAIDVLNDDGWDIDMPELASSELLVEGTAVGGFEMSRGAANAVMLANEQGFPVTKFVESVKNEWVLHSRAEYESCEDLDGVTLAIHSEGSPPTFMTRNWIAENCPETEPVYLILPGSPNRYAALLAGEIDATPVDVGDSMQLQAEGGDEFRLQVDFSESEPDLVTHNIFGNTEWLEEHPIAAQHFVATLLQEHRRFADDPAYMVDRVRELIPEAESDILEEIVEVYAEREMLDPNGGLTRDTQEYTTNWVYEAGLIESRPDPDDIYDRAWLDPVLDALGEY